MRWIGDAFQLYHLFLGKVSLHFGVFVSQEYPSPSSGRGVLTLASSARIFGRLIIIHNKTNTPIKLSLLGICWLPIQFVMLH